MAALDRLEKEESKDTLTTQESTQVDSQSNSSTITGKEKLPDHAVTEEDFQIIRKKCEVFNKWCDEVGIFTPKIEYPAFFDNGLLGGRVKQPIEHREAYLYVPFKAMMSIDKALRDPEMGDFYEKNP